jgi:hypothetical protein
MTSKQRRIAMTDDEQHICGALRNSLEEIRDGLRPVKFDGPLWEKVPLVADCALATDH